MRGRPPPEDSAAQEGHHILGSDLSKPPI
jgi:hypothetical protein